MGARFYSDSSIFSKTDWMDLLTAEVLWDGGPRWTLLLMETLVYHTKMQMNIKEFYECLLLRDLNLFTNKAISFGENQFQTTYKKRDNKCIRENSCEIFPH